MRPFRLIISLKLSLLVIAIFRLKENQQKVSLLRNDLTSNKLASYTPSFDDNWEKIIQTEFALLNDLMI